LLFPPIGLTASHVEVLPCRSRPIRSKPSSLAPAASHRARNRTASLIDELDLLEIQSESTLPVFAFDQPSEVWEMLAVDATTQR